MDWLMISISIGRSRFSTGAVPCSQSVPCYKSFSVRDFFYAGDFNSLPLFNYLYKL